MPLSLFALSRVSSRTACFRFSLAAILGVILFAAVAPTADAQIVPTTSEVPAEVKEQVHRDLFGGTAKSGRGPLAAIGQHLVVTYREYQWHRQAKGAAPYEPSLPFVRVYGDYVAVDAVATESGSALLRQMKDLGLRRGAQVERVVSGLVPLARLGDLAELPALRYAAPVMYARPTPPPLDPTGADGDAASTGTAPKVGATTTQGDGVMQTPEVRSGLDVNGDGVTIGVLSDTYDQAPNPGTEPAEDIASGDLPGPDNPNGFTTPVEVLDDPSFEEAIDEGRAMIQIMHDVAPGADYIFDSGFLGQANFAAGVRELQSRGAGVIVDDIGYFEDPMFQDGLIARAIEDVTAQGAVYLSSAGNSGTSGYGDAFNPASATPGRLQTSNVPHEFGPGETLQTIRIPQGAEISIALHWNDSYATTGGPGAQTNLDAYLTTADGTQVLASVENDDNGGSGNGATDPSEVLQFTNTTESTTFQLGIEFVDGPQFPDFIRWVAFGPVTPTEFTDDDPSNPADGPATLFGHANAESAISVAASAYFFTPQFFSSLTARGANTYTARGGVPILYDDDGNRLASPEDRRKPDVTGPDGVNTTFFGSDTGVDADTFPNFFGTSAAAPHIAAVAALIRSVEPSATAADIVGAIEQTATDLTTLAVVGSNGSVSEQPIADAATPDGTGGTGFDRRTGAGFIVADEAVRSFADVANFRIEGSGGEGRTLRWRQFDNATVTRYTLNRTYVDALPTVPANRDSSIATEGPGEYVVELPDLPTGRHEFRLTYTLDDGTVEQTPLVTTTVSLGQTAEVQGPFPNPPEAQRAFLRISTDRSQDVDVEVFDALGRLVAEFPERVEANRPETIRLGGPGRVQLGRLGSGVYFIRVTGRDFAATNRMVIVR